MLEGDPAYEFYEILGARRLTDGRIVIADGGASEIRYYDSRGAHLVSVGREGEGPGEFGGISSMATTSGDTVLVLDWRNRRVSYFDPSGTFHRSVPLHFLSEMGGSPTLMSPFDDGTLIVGVQDFFGSGVFGEGLTRGQIVYVRCDTTGALMDTLAVKPGIELYTAVQGDNRMAGVRPFGHSPRAAAHRNGFFHGSGDSYEIEHFDKEGNLRRSYRRPIANMEVSDADVDGYKRDRIENADDETQRRISEVLVDAIPFPDAFPAYGDLVVDAEGNLWVEAYRTTKNEQPRWTVFDGSGRMLGEVQTPEPLTVFQIGADFILGLWEDDLDVQHIVMYELFKN
jgi:hypothetical protein